MRHIALNGFGYRLTKFFGPNVETPFRWNWTVRHADALSKTINGPTTITGFSDGATAALQIATNNPYIVAAYIHSPMLYVGVIRRIPQSLTVFRTEGDKTPTYEGAFHSYARVKMLRTENVTLIPLPYVSFDRPTLFERLFLIRNRHIFHNCLDYLPPEMI